jgi:iron complex outermembrane receptor protein
MSQEAAIAPESASQSSDASVADIVVTGEKINRTLQQTPASVAVTTSKTIQDQSLIDIYDVLERTPNVTPNGTHTDFTIRGIDAFNSIGGDGALASVYLDGAVLPQTALAVGPLDLFDISQVEVFRGPQSTVQGRNALAGAVIIRTADPTYDWTGRVRLLLSGKNGERRAGAAIGGPLVDGQIAFRLAGEIAREDGLIDNVTLHTKGDQRASETLRGKLLFTPSFAPDLKVVASFMHDRHRRGTYWVEFDAPYTLQDRISTENVLDQVVVKSDIATVEIGYDLAKGLSLSSVTNYSNIRSVDSYDQDRGGVDSGSGLIRDPSKTFQQELRLNIDKSWVKGLIGAYYLRDDNRNYLFVTREEIVLRNLGVDQVLLGMGVPQPAVDAVLNLYGGSAAIADTLRQPQLTKNYAGFADLTFPITRRLRIVAGLRYDHETQDRGATQTITLTRALPDPASAPIALQPIVTALNGVLNGIVLGANSDEPIRTIAYHAWLPKLGATYDLARDVSFSITAQRGYRAGGAGLNQQRAQYYTYNPEYTWNFEAALRSEFFDHKLTINANVYDIEWKNQQVSVQLTPGSRFDTQTVNAGKSRLYGAELALTGRLARTLSVYASAGYSHSRFLSFKVPAGATFEDLTGNEFPNAPHWTLAGGGTWQHPSGLFANVNATYRSGLYQDAATESVRDIRPITLVNAKVGWQNDHLGMFLIASNIFNVEKATQSFVDNDGRTRGVVSDPRILGLSFEGRF